MTIKDSITLILSILAFLISTLTSYFTLVRQTDDVRAVIQATPITKVENNRIELSSIAVTLINAGNRSAVVHSIWLQLDQTSEGGNNKGCQSGAPIGIDLRELILKDKDIASRELALTPITGVSDGATLGVALLPENQKRGHFPLEVCIGFQVSTPSRAMVEKVVTLFRFERYEPDVGFGGPHTAAPKSFTVLRQTGTIFSD